MENHLEIVVKAFQEWWGAQLEEFRGQVTLKLLPELITEAAQSLRDEFDFNMLMDLTAVDYWPQQEPRFHLVYQFYSMKKNIRLTLRTELAGNDPYIHTIDKIYPNTNWYERECWDMFGIHFDESIDQRRILMPFDWQGHPLRKDYPLGYEEVQFTFNYQDIDLRKPHGKE